MSAESLRREEILQTAASLFASSGIRTSLKEIGDACGILPGSLYHHFESKDAIVIELVRRYRNELHLIAGDALDRQRDTAGPDLEARVVRLGEAIAACAVKHRAALLLTLHEPPSASSDELLGVARDLPAEMTAAMTRLLEDGRRTGEIRPGIDLALLSERICQSMLHVGLGVLHRSQAARHQPAQKCRIYLRGVAARAPDSAELDSSAAMRAAREAITGWSRLDHGDRISHLRAVARVEFARRGYQATTMREIAQAAEISMGTVYRLFRSKDELLESIMGAFVANYLASWNAVLGSNSSPLEKLDALQWVNINLLDRFTEEFKIQLAWLQQSPPESIEIGLAYGQLLRQLQRLVTIGQNEGDLRLDGGSMPTRLRSLFEVIFTTDHVVRQAGPPAALTLARESVLSGALSRG